MTKKASSKIHRCVECGEPLFVELVTTPYPESGLSNVVLQNIPMWRCANGHEEVEIPALRQLHEVLTFQILRKPASLSGEEVRFLRKRIGMSAREFGAHLGIHHVTVSRLEHGKRRLLRPLDLLIRLFCAQFIAAKRGLQLPDDLLPILEELEQRGLDLGQHRFEHVQSEEPRDQTPASEWRSVAT